MGGLGFFVNLCPFSSFFVHVEPLCQCNVCVQFVAPVSGKGVMLG